MQDYWTNRKEYEDRNEQIVKDKESGMSTMDICFKYGKLTPARIYTIVKNYKIRKAKDAKIANK